MSGPSDKAEKRAVEANLVTTTLEANLVRTGVRRAHDPALGPDRSVCLRSLIDKLRAWERGEVGVDIPPADFIEREFGGGS